MCRIQTILTIPSSVFPKAKNEIRTGLFCCLRLYISYQLCDAYLVVFEFTPTKQKKKGFLAVTFSLPYHQLIVGNGHRVTAFLPTCRSHPFLNWLRPLVFRAI